MPRHQASEKPTVSGATRIITSIDTWSPNPEQSAPPVIIWFGVVQHGELGAWHPVVIAVAIMDRGFDFEKIKLEEVVLSEIFQSVASSSSTAPRTATS